MYQRITNLYKRRGTEQWTFYLLTIYEPGELNNKYPIPKAKGYMTDINGNGLYMLNDLSVQYAGKSEISFAGLSKGAVRKRLNRRFKTLGWRKRQENV